LGYINDAEFARVKAEGLMRRGYGSRRVEAMLHQSKVAEDDAVDARDIAISQHWAAAVRFAQKRRVGPFANQDAPPLDPAAKQKALAAFLRAGHGFADAQRLLSMAGGGDVHDVLENDGENS
jgi:regulatory protein